ncbi:MAG: Fic family protein [Planctomycetes bacterium]|nr:Fic family protein [Planctomycetota bacterium]
MARIIPPPDLEAVLRKSIDKITATYRGPEVVAYVQKHNNAYTAWEKLKRLPAPAELTAEEAWACVKLSRTQRYRELPISDMSGRRFRYWLPDSALELLHRIDRDASGLLTSGQPNLPGTHESERYLVASLMEEAISSSILEGAVTTRAEAKRMLKEGRRPRTEAEHMVANNYAVIRRIQSLQDKSLSAGMLNELHRIVTRNTLEPDVAGRFQRPGEKRVNVVSVRDGEVVHIPPPAEELPERMAEVVRFANDASSQPFHHPVVRAIMLHFAIAYVHPYADGNGRTARAAFYWSMLRQGYWLTQYIAVSSVIRRAPVKYYVALKHSEIDEGDVTYFILYHLRVIDRAIAEFRDYLERKQAEMEATSRRLREYPGLNYRQRALIAHAVRHPDGYYTIDSHAGSHRVSYHTARSDLRHLVALGLLRKVHGRPIHFVPAPDLSNTIAREDR